MKCSKTRVADPPDGLTSSYFGMFTFSSKNKVKLNN